MTTLKSSVGIVVFGPAMIGKPFIWRTALYGDIAVHVTKFSPNGAVANLSIDGGEASTPAQWHSVLSDGIGFAVEGQLFKRPATRTRKAPAVKVLAEAAGIVRAERHKPTHTSRRRPTIPATEFNTATFVPTPPTLQKHINRLASEETF